MTALEGQKMPETVGEALALAHETEKKLKQAGEILAVLTDAGVRKPSVLSELVGPTERIRDTLSREIGILRDIIARLEAQTT